MAAKATTHEEYIAGFPADVQKVLKTVRTTIQKAVPGTEEVISYSIPAFKLNGNWIFYYSAYTSHFSLSCPPTGTLFETFKKELSKYKTSKSTIQFPYDQPVPTKLITDMAKLRAKEAKEGKKGKG